MVDLKAKEVELLQRNAMGHGTPPAGMSRLLGSGMVPSAPTETSNAGLDPNRVLLVPTCRRKSGPEHLRALFLDRAGESLVIFSITLFISFQHSQGWLQDQGQ
jgi:hypothetical protein